MSTVHIPVLMDEVLEALQLQPDGIYLDGTFGGGGHSTAIAKAIRSGAEQSELVASNQERLGNAPRCSGRVIAVDRDPAAVEAADSIELIQQLPIEVYAASYVQLPELLRELDIAAVDGILLDLGLSSDQLACRERGFSFESHGDLDLRFDPQLGEPAWKLLNRLSESHLADLIYQFGEERLSRRVASAIVKARRENDLRSAKSFADVVSKAVAAGQRRKGMQQEKIHPATRSFQAFRIAVNDELDHLKQALKHLPNLLRPGGRLAIISFHSLEDRLVKEAFRDDDRLEVITRKPIRPTESEIGKNRRSRSSRLRVAARSSS